MQLLPLASPFWHGGTHLANTGVGIVTDLVCAPGTELKTPNPTTSTGHILFALADVGTVTGLVENRA